MRGKLLCIRNYNTMDRYKDIAGYIYRQCKSTQICQMLPLKYGWIVSLSSIETIKAKE